MEVQKARKQMISPISLRKAVQASYPAFATLRLPSPTNKDGLTAPHCQHRPRPIHVLVALLATRLVGIHAIDQNEWE